MSNEFHVVGPTGQTCYFHLFNSASQRANITNEVFEVFSAADYGDYDFPAIEDGSTGVFIGSMPTWAAAGAYDAVLFRQAGASPANGDRAQGAQGYTWRGVGGSVGTIPLGSLTGTQMAEYIRRGGWIRDDMDTELYDALTDTILEMEQLFDFAERQTETISTDTIDTLGDYKIDIEADFGNLISIVLIDGTFSQRLVKTSKALYDILYPNPGDDQVRAFPYRYSLFGRQLLIGPAPDKITYEYRMAYSQRLTTAVDASTDPVPFSAEYREVLKDGTLARLFENVGKTDRADRFAVKYAGGVGRITAKERRDRGGAGYVAYNDC